MYCIASCLLIYGIGMVIFQKVIKKQEMKNDLEEIVFTLRTFSSPVLAFYFLSSDIENSNYLNSTSNLLSEGFESEIRPVDSVITYLIVYIRESSFQNWNDIQETIKELHDLIGVQIHKVEFISGRFKSLPQN